MWAAGCDIALHCKGDMAEMQAVALAYGDQSPDIRARALAALRRCGYLDIIDGTNLNDVVDAESAVSELMNERRGRP